MTIDLAGFIWNADMLLFAVVVLLSAQVIVSAVVADDRRSRRQFYLERVREVMAVLALSDKQVVRQACPEIIDGSTAQEFFELARFKDAVIPVQLNDDFRLCLQGTRTVAELERQANHPGRSWSRIQALLAIGSAQSEHAGQILAQALNDRDESVSYYAMLGLAQLKTPEAARLLLGIIPSRRFSAQKIASLLEGFPAADGVPELLKAARASDATLRFWALRVLGSYRDICCQNEVIALCDDPSADVRAAACEYLSRVSDPAALAVLRKHIADTVWFVRLHALRSLEKSAGQEAVGPAADALADANWFVREEAKRILCAYPQRALPLVRRMMDGKQAGKQDCCEVLRNLGVEA